MTLSPEKPPMMALGLVFATEEVYRREALVGDHQMLRGLNWVAECSESKKLTTSQRLSAQWLL
jgi:hypothetical protein